MTRPGPGLLCVASAALQWIPKCESKGKRIFNCARKHHIPSGDVLFVFLSAMCVSVYFITVLSMEYTDKRGFFPVITGEKECLSVTLMCFFCYE